MNIFSSVSPGTIIPPPWAVAPAPASVVPPPVVRWWTPSPPVVWGRTPPPVVPVIPVVPPVVSVTPATSSSGSSHVHARSGCMSSLGDAEVHSNFPSVQFHPTHGIPCFRSIFNILVVDEGKTSTTSAVAIQHYLDSLQRSEFSELLFQLAFSRVQAQPEHPNTLTRSWVFSVADVSATRRHWWARVIASSLALWSWSRSWPTRRGAASASGGHVNNVDLRSFFSIFKILLLIFISKRKTQFEWGGQNLNTWDFLMKCLIL